MSATTYKTNLNCASCVAAVKPYLDSEKAIEGRASPQRVEALVGQAGFRVFGRLDQRNDNQPAVAPKGGFASVLTTYYPLILVLVFISGVVVIAEWRSGSFSWHQAMNNFMGGFFVVFSFFKLLNLQGFADAYQTYDVLARRIPAYGYVYPFIELILGAAYLAGAFPVATNIATVVVMVLGLVGVTKALLAKKQIRCACLGTVFNLPMSYVTFIEDGLMAAMALVMLLVSASS
jgi:hypothetical protein